MYIHHFKCIFAIYICGCYDVKTLILSSSHWAEQMIIFNPGLLWVFRCCKGCGISEKFVFGGWGAVIDSNGACWLLMWFGVCCNFVKHLFVWSLLLI